jgi:hypothetical protein
VDVTCSAHEGKHICMKYFSAEVGRDSDRLREFGVF